MEPEPLRFHVRNLGNCWALALVFAANVLNIFDRQIINVLSQEIKVELQLSDASLGLLTGTAFGIFYSVLGLPLGQLADRIDRVKMMAGALAIWSSFTAFCGLSANFVQLFLSRMGVGVGEAGATPASTALVAELFPKERRSTALSVLLVGAPVGSFLGLLVGGYAGATWGWRMAFLLAAAPGLVLAVAMLLTMKDPRRGRPLEKSPGGLMVAIKALGRHPTLLWLSTAMACSVFMVYATGAWLPAFFIRAHGLELAATGAYLSFAVGIGGSIGAIGAGIICDTLRARFSNIETRTAVIALLASMPCLGITVFAQDTRMALAALLPLNILVFAYLAPMATLIQAQARLSMRGVVMGGCLTIANILSLGFGLPLVGVISDGFTGPFGAPGVGYALLASSVGVILVGVLAHLLAARSARTAEPLGWEQLAPEQLRP